MKKSLWLQSYEKEVSTKRNKSNQNKKLILIIIPLMLLVFLIPAFANGAAADPQAQGGMVALVLVFAVIMLFAIIMIRIGKKKDVASQTRKNVMSLLKNDADVERFDQQMSAGPIKEVTISSETSVFLTEDYVGQKYMLGGDLQYRFIRRNDIASFHRAKTTSTTANPLKAAYFFDIRDCNQQVIFNGLADSGKQLEELFALLQLAQPNIQQG